MYVGIKQLVDIIWVLAYIIIISFFFSINSTIFTIYLTNMSCDLSCILNENEMDFILELKISPTTVIDTTFDKIN